MKDKAYIKQDCYCDSLNDQYLKENSIPKGFCGICEICKKPGHTQHFPGAVPYTGAWCNECLQIVAKNHKIRSVIFMALFLLVISLIIGGVIWGVIEVIKNTF